MGLPEQRKYVYHTKNSKSEGTQLRNEGGFDLRFYAVQLENKSADEAVQVYCKASRIGLNLSVVRRQTRVSHHS